MGVQTFPFARNLYLLNTGEPDHPETYVLYIAWNYFLFIRRVGKIAISDC